jgi:hypothetical protein
VSVIRWEEPPTSRRGNEPAADWPAIADALKARPGVWAVVLEGEPQCIRTHGHRITTGKNACFTPPGAFQSRARTEGGTARLYARYVGEVAA